MRITWTCDFCGKEHESPNGTGSDVSCCGEVGHAHRTIISDNGRIEVGYGNERVQIWTYDNFTVNMTEISMQEVGELINMLKVVDKQP